MDPSLQRQLTDTVKKFRQIPLIYKHVKSNIKVERERLAVYKRRFSKDRRWKCLIPPKMSFGRHTYLTFVNTVCEIFPFRELKSFYDAVCLFVDEYSLIANELKAMNFSCCRALMALKTLGSTVLDTGNVIYELYESKSVSRLRKGLISGYTLVQGLSFFTCWIRSLIWKSFLKYKTMKREVGKHCKVYVKAVKFYKMLYSPINIYRNIKNTILGKSLFTKNISLKNKCTRYMYDLIKYINEQKGKRGVVSSNNTKKAKEKVLVHKATMTESTGKLNNNKKKISRKKFSSSHLKIKR